MFNPELLIASLDDVLPDWLHKGLLDVKPDSDPEYHWSAYLKPKSGGFLNLALNPAQASKGILLIDTGHFDARRKHDVGRILPNWLEEKFLLQNHEGMCQQCIPLVVLFDIDSELELPCELGQHEDHLPFVRSLPKQTKEWIGKDDLIMLMKQLWEDWKENRPQSRKIDLTPARAEVREKAELFDAIYVKEKIGLLDHLMSQLSEMALGQTTASEFENWVFRAVQVIFSGQLNNFELKPNKDSIQRRDIVATNMAEKGFWRRIYDDYGTRELVIEVKNYSNLKEKDFRQVLSYSRGPYGKFIIIVNRNSSEDLPQKEKDWIKEMWDEHGLLIFVLSAPVLVKFMTELKTRMRVDVVENQLNKQLDTYVRLYLSLKHAKPK